MHHKKGTDLHTDADRPVAHVGPACCLYWVVVDICKLVSQSTRSTKLFGSVTKAREAEAHCKAGSRYTMELFCNAGSAGVPDHGLTNNALVISTDSLVALMHSKQNISHWFLHGSMQGHGCINLYLFLASRLPVVLTTFPPLPSLSFTNLQHANRVDRCC